MIHVGTNVYCWGGAQQDRLLVEHFGPLARETEHLRGFYFTRFDARGPHLFLLYSTTAESAAALAERVAERARRAVAQAPSTTRVDPGELAERHAQCRGKALCEADREDAMAENNSFVVFEQDGAGYPFYTMAGVAAAEELWQLLGELSLWAVEQLGRPNVRAAAVRWTAEVDRALAGTRIPAQALWRYHATTLILPLAERLETEEEEVLASLPSAVGASNAATFSKVWQAVESAPPAWPQIERLLEVVLAEDGRSLAQRLRLLREINHVTLGQLGQGVRFHIPLVLYAWQRNLSPAQTA